uniref:Uncharacterized protein n=1 Tax=Maylandia zebra TaxID=106582 RepID=A0A3P9AU65_9CICH
MCLGDYDCCCCYYYYYYYYYYLVCCLHCPLAHLYVGRYVCVCIAFLLWPSYRHLQPWGLLAAHLLLIWLKWLNISKHK